MTSIHDHKSILAEDRESARQLRLDIRLHENDLKWMKDNKGIIIYAIDNDIMKLHSAAKEVALGGDIDDERKGYTQVFSGDEEENIVGIARILTHFIFYKLACKRLNSLFFIPPLDAEFSLIFEAVFKNAGREITQADNNIGILDSVFNNKSMSDEEVARHLIKYSKPILEILIGNQSYNSEIQRLTNLLNEKRVRSLNDIGKDNISVPLDFLEAVNKKKSLKEMVWTSSLRDKWLEKLMVSGGGDHKRERAEYDASALASLQLINSRLKDENIKLILITGSPRILRIGRKISIKERGEVRTFSDLWLRHPRCYLGDPNLLEGENAENNFGGGKDIAILLDAFLAEETSVDSDNYKEIGPSEEASSFEVSNLYENELLEFHSAWNELSNRLCLAHADIIKDSCCETPEVIELVKLVRSSGNSIHQFLMDSWHTAFLTASQAGFLVTWHLKKSSRRNIPKLHFESFESASKFVADVLVQMQHNPGTEINNFHTRISEVRNDPSHGYTTYLVLGVLFAAQDHWHVTASLANLALRKIYGTSKNSVMRVVAEDRKRAITGREAFYLKAVSDRHNARSIAELDEALNAIILASNILDLEREKRGKEILEADKRFEYEMCSINVAGYMFERFLNEKNTLFIDKLSISDLLLKLSDLLIRNDCKYCTEQSAENCRDCGRVLTSIFIIEITLVAKIGSTFPAELSGYLDKFREIQCGTQLKNPTMLTNVVFSVADWWGEGDIAIKEEKQNTANKYIESSINNIKKSTAMPYEFERHRYFKQFVNIQI